MLKTSLTRLTIDEFDDRYLCLNLVMYNLTSFFFFTSKTRIIASIWYDYAIEKLSKVKLIK